MRVPDEHDDPRGAQGDRQDERRAVGRRAAELHPEGARRGHGARRVGRARRRAVRQLHGGARPEGLEQGQHDPRRDGHVDPPVDRRPVARVPAHAGVVGRRRLHPLLRRPLLGARRARSSAATSRATARRSTRCRRTRCTTTSGRTPPTSASTRTPPRSPATAGRCASARSGKGRFRATSHFHWYSPGLDLNDVGYLRQADVKANQVFLGWSESRPKGIFREYSFQGSREDQWDFGGLHTKSATGARRATPPSRTSGACTGQRRLQPARRHPRPLRRARAALERLLGRPRRSCSSDNVAPVSGGLAVRARLDARGRHASAH